MPLGRGLNSLIPDKKTMMPLVMGLATRPVATGNGAAQTIDVDLIDPNPYQPRKEFDEAALQSLAESIKAHGVIQPIVVSPAPVGRYYLVIGERRLRAAKMAGLREIPAHVRSTKDQEKLELALIENIQREDLNPLEEAAGYRQLKDEFGLTIAEIGRRTGKSEPVIIAKLHVLDLPDVVKEALVSGKLTYVRARALAQLTDQPDDLMRLWRESEAKGWSVHELERAATQLRDRSTSVGRKRGGRKPLNPVILEKQRELEEALGTKARLTHTNKSSTITLTFFSDEEFYKTIERLLLLRD